MDWPTAFVLAVLIVSVLALLGWIEWVRARIMRDAIDNGATAFRWTSSKETRNDD